MKYQLLTYPGTNIQKGDQYILSDNLVNNERPDWQNETNPDSFGKRIDCYPTFSFRRPIPNPIEVRLNASYIANVTPLWVKVGCTSFTHEVVLELAEKVKEIQRQPKERINT